MPIDILMPALSPTMEEGTLIKWFVKEGDKVSAGDIIAEIETDKATMEFETVDDGIISALLIKTGTEGVKINTPIATIQSEQEESIKKINPKVSKNEALNNESLKINHKKTPHAKSGEKTVREAIRDAMAEEMRLDDEVFLMGEEVADYQGAYKVSQGLIEEFGDRRVIDTPITEHGFTGLAIGAAFAGLKPIVEFMTFNFALQAMDQIINSAAKTLYMSGGQMGCPIVFRGPNGAAARVAAQHSQDFAAWFSSIPGLKVIQPYTSRDAKGLLKSAIRDPNPVIFLENEILYGQSFDISTISDKDELIPIGKANLYQEGTDITLISFGIGMKHTVEAAKILEGKNVSCEIIDLRTLRPLDNEAILQSVKKTNRCITIEEGFPVCSVGNHISAMLMENAFDYLDAPVINCTGKDVPMPYASNLEKEAMLTADTIVSAIEKIL
jgi:pyruvate dehydrogenase E1 component beta subunit